MDAWSLLDEAVAAPAELRSERLHAALDALEVDPGGSVADRVELKAVVLCELASIGATSLKAAMDGVDDAAMQGRKGWPNYYLAKTAVQIGDYQLVEHCLDEIPSGFFDERRLAWRSLHLREIAAISKLKRGDFQGARGLVHEIAGALATRGDEDDLASPKDLVLRFLAEIENGSHEARDLLDILATSIDVSVWFDQPLAERVREALD